jgi:hypothetical protein
MIRADLRREAQAWRPVKLARAELNPSRSTTQPAHSLQPKHNQAAHSLAVAGRTRGEIRRVALTLVPGRAQQ